MNDYARIYDTAMRGYQAAILEEQAKFQQAQLMGDFNESVRASQTIATYRAQMNEYHRMAVEQAKPAQAAAAGPARDKHGLTPEEREVALNSYGPIKTNGEKYSPNSRKGEMRDLTEDEKLQLYAQKKQELQRKRASGEYRQTTDQTG